MLRRATSGDICCSEEPGPCSQISVPPHTVQHGIAQHSRPKHSTAGGTSCSEEPASAGPAPRLAACLCAATLGVNWAASNNSRGPSSRKGRNTVTRKDARTRRSHRSRTVRACSLAAWSPRPNRGAASSFASYVCMHHRMLSQIGWMRDRWACNGIGKPPCARQKRPFDTQSLPLLTACNCIEDPYNAGPKTYDT